jgi:hypothetical protein
MRLDVRALDRLIVEIVEVIDYRDAPIALSDQAVNEM